PGLLDPGCIADIADTLAADDFGVMDHRAVYTAMLTCHSRGQRPDLVTVADELESTQQTRLSTDIYVLVGENATVLPMHIGDYARSVMRHSRRRSVLSHATDLIQKLHQDADADPVELAHQVMADVSRIGDTDDGPKLYADVIEAFQERLTLQVAGAWDERVMPTR